MGVAPSDKTPAVSFVVVLMLPRCYAVDCLKHRQVTDSVEGLSSILETLLEYRTNGSVIAVAGRGLEIQ